MELTLIFFIYSADLNLAQNIIDDKPYTMKNTPKIVK